MGGLCVLGDRTGIQRSRINVQPAPRLDDIGRDQAHDQSQCREDEEVSERLGRHATDAAQIAHTGNAGHDGQEDHRRDDHLHQFDEGIAQWLEAFAENGPKVADHRTGHNGRQDLKIQVAIKRPTNSHVL